MNITETKVVTCKNCGSTAVVRFGTYKGVQRYWCKTCKRKFKADSAAFHAKVPSAYISQAVAEFYTGSSINDIRETLYQEHGYRPSKSIVWKWITKYTDLAVKHFRDYHPKVGDVWSADETMVDLDKGFKVWVYNVVDERSRYLLASRISLARTTREAEAVMKEAQRRAGKTPKQVLTDANTAYDDGLELAFGADTVHVKTSPFTRGANTDKVERYHGTYKDRVKVMRAFRDTETLIQFNDGWLVYYNYFKPHQAVGNKTPAEAAGLQYDVKNWADLAHLPVSKESECITHAAPRTRVPRHHTDMTFAFKRHRQPRLIAPHRTRHGMGITRRSDR